MMRKSWTKAAGLACGLGMLSAPGWAGNDAAIKELKNLGGPEAARAIVVGAAPKTVPVAAPVKVNVGVWARKCIAVEPGRVGGGINLVVGDWDVNDSDFQGGLNQVEHAVDSAEGTLNVWLTYTVGDDQVKRIVAIARYTSKGKGTPVTQATRLMADFTSTGSEVEAGACDVPSDIGTILLSIETIRQR